MSHVILTVNVELVDLYSSLSTSLLCNPERKSLCRACDAILREASGGQGVYEDLEESAVIAGIGFSLPGEN